MSKGTQRLRAEAGHNIRDSLGVGDPEMVLQELSTDKVDKFKGSERIGEARNIPIDQVHPDPNQPRKSFPPEDIRGLATTIGKRGLLQPIRVRWDEQSEHWIILTGERRWRAAQLAGLEKIPAIISNTSGIEILLEQLIENCQRNDITGIEKARAFKELMDKTSWNQTRVSQEVGYSTSQISRILSGLKLPEEKQEEILSGAISIRDASDQTIQKQKRVSKKDKVTRFHYKDGEIKVTVEIPVGYAEESDAVDALRTALSKAEASEQLKRR